MQYMRTVQYMRKMQYRQHMSNSTWGGIVSEGMQYAECGYLPQASSMWRMDILDQNIASKNLMSPKDSTASLGTTRESVGKVILSANDDEVEPHDSTGVFDTDAASDKGPVTAER